MEDSDTTSNLSSLADVPPYLREQYTPLGDVFQVHSSQLPSKKSPESNSNGQYGLFTAVPSVLYEVPCTCMSGSQVYIIVQ